MDEEVDIDGAFDSCVDVEAENEAKVEAVLGVALADESK